MGKVVFSTGSRHVNKIDRCECGAKKLAFEKRCIKCQIERKDEIEEDRNCTQDDDSWQAVDKFMEGLE